MTWRLFIARPTGNLTRHGLKEKSWREVPSGLASDADNEAAREFVEAMAKRYGAAKATRGAVTISQFAAYSATEVRA